MSAPGPSTGSGREVTGPSTGPRCVGAYGHSWAFGTGAAHPNRGFASLTATALGLALDNRAVSGSLSTETALLVTSSLPPSAGLLVIMTGLNDVRLNGRSALERGVYADVLATIFEVLRDASPGALVLAVEQPHIRDYAGYAPFHRGSGAVIDAYNATLRQVARQHSAGVVGVPGWSVDAMISDDGVHPNDIGHHHLAQAVVRACRQSRWFTDQKAAPSSAASELRSAGRISR